MKTLDKHNIPFILCVHSTDTNKLIKSQHPCIDIRQVQPKSNRKHKFYKDQKNQPRTWNGLFHMDQKVAKELLPHFINILNNRGFKSMFFIVDENWNLLVNWFIRRSKSLSLPKSCSLYLYFSVSAILTLMPIGLIQSTVSRNQPLWKKGKKYHNKY